MLAFGSDWTVSTANPLREIEVAVRRVDPGDPDGEPFLPDERVDLPAAIDAFTSGSAYALRLEAETGSVTPASWPTSPSWTATRSTRPPAPSPAPGPGHPGRGRAGPRRPVLDLG